MTLPMLWPLIAALCVALAVALALRGADGADARLECLRAADRGGWRSDRCDGIDGDAVSAGLTVALVLAAVRQGSSISVALREVGDVLPGRQGAVLRRASEALHRGCGWRQAWIAAGLDADAATAGDASGINDDGGNSGQRAACILCDALEDSWIRGASPVDRLEMTIDKLDADARHELETAAERLTVRLLVPTGLCMLPAFVLIGVVPTLAAFMQ